MEEEKLQSSPGEGNNKKMFPLANEDSNFFWPDTTDLFNLDSPRLQAENLPTPITGFENHYKSLICQHFRKEDIWIINVGLYIRNVRLYIRNVRLYIKMYVYTVEMNFCTLEMYFYTLEM